MKIVEVTYEHIKFDNGSMITFDHVQHCCEDNYADFEQIEERALETEFDEELIFEAVEGSGFRFGSKGTPIQATIELPPCKYYAGRKCFHPQNPRNARSNQRPARRCNISNERW